MLCLKIFRARLWFDLFYLFLKRKQVIWDCHRSGELLFNGSEELYRYFTRELKKEVMAKFSQLWNVSPLYLLRVALVVHLFRAALLPSQPCFLLWNKLFIAGNPPPPRLFQPWPLSPRLIIRINKSCNYKIFQLPPNFFCLLNCKNASDRTVSFLINVAPDA